MKVEDSPRNPGEACIESLSQQALLQTGLGTAPTQSLVIAELQCVVNGRVIPIYQEEFRQAGDFGPEKYPAVFDSCEMRGWRRTMSCAMARRTPMRSAMR